MAKLILKSIIFLIYFFNTIFAQSTQVALTGLNNFNLTTTCRTSIESLIDNKSINKCLPMFTITASIPSLLPTAQENPESKISLLAQLIQQTCSLPKCPSSLVQSASLKLQESCSQDLFQQNIMATLNLIMFSHYQPIQELTCKRDRSRQFNPYCILETIINIANSTTLIKRHEKDAHPNIITPTSITDPDPTITEAAVNPPSSPNSPTSEAAANPPISSTDVNDGNDKNNNDTFPISSPSQDSSSIFKTLESLPNSLVCTDCNKAMVSVVLKYINENPKALIQTQIQPSMIQQGSQVLELKCGSSFLDGTTPNTISGSSKLLRSYFYNFFGFFITGVLLLLL